MSEAPLFDGTANESDKSADAAYEPFENDGRESYDDDRYSVKLPEARQLNTIADAVDYCNTLLLAQLQRAIVEKPGHNEAIAGDSNARRAMLTLLPKQFVRELFLRFTRRREAWPRLAPLFGAPPYAFLLPQDAGLVRAAGIAHGRVHMAYDTGSATLTYSQFGVSHFEDSFMRQYRIMSDSNVRATDRLPCDISSDSKGRIVLNVRVPKRSNREKQRRAADQHLRASLFFPRVGEILRMKPSASLQSVRGRNSILSTLQVKVQNMVPRGVRSSTAAVLGVIE